MSLICKFDKIMFAASENQGRVPRRVELDLSMSPHERCFHEDIIFEEMQRVRTSIQRHLVVVAFCFL